MTTERWVIEPRGWWPELPGVMGRNRTELLRIAQRRSKLSSEARRHLEIKELEAEMRLLKEVLKAGKDEFPKDWQSIVVKYMQEGDTKTSARLCRRCKSNPVGGNTLFCKACKSEKNRKSFRDSKRRSRCPISKIFAHSG